MTWKTITEQPGYFGRGRDKIIRENNEHYGEGNWRTVWRLGFNLLDFDQACQVYQAGYFVDSFNREGKWLELFKMGKDVYDLDWSDINSKFDYREQNNVANHLQDIAVRNVGMLRGFQFEGDEYIRIRGRNTKWGELFSPGRVLFYDPKMITTPRLSGWWNQDSIEDFWQSNKLLQARDN